MILLWDSCTTVQKSKQHARCDRLPLKALVPVPYVLYLFPRFPRHNLPRLRNLQRHVGNPSPPCWADVFDIEMVPSTISIRLLRIAPAGGRHTLCCVKSVYMSHCPMSRPGLGRSKFRIMTRRARDGAIASCSPTVCFHPTAS